MTENKYKVGDKIRVKDKDFPDPEVNNKLNALSPKRVLTIKRITKGHLCSYTGDGNLHWVKEVRWWFGSEYIEPYVGYIKKSKVSRFKLMDLSD